jgi:hypothetical protein
MRAQAPQLPYAAQPRRWSTALRAAALEALARVDLTPLDAHQTFHLAESFAMAGDTATAMTLLEYAVDHGM